jgi:pilus assembly protein Flp/PilA
MLMFLMNLRNFLAQPLRRDDRGATAVEYGLLVALIAVVVGIAAATMGTAIAGVFGNVTAHL